MITCPALLKLTMQIHHDRPARPAKPEQRLRVISRLRHRQLALALRGQVHDSARYARRFQRLAERCAA